MRGWPEDHDKALKRHFEAGLSFAQIAAKMHAEIQTSYSRNSCIGRANRIGLTQAQKPKPKPEKPEVVVHVRKPRTAPKPIVQEFACDVTTGLRIVDVRTRDITIHQLTDATCRWPRGDRAPYTFCGCLPYPGSSYCAEHHALSVAPGTRSEQMATRGLERVS